MANTLNTLSERFVASDQILYACPVARKTDRLQGVDCVLIIWWLRLFIVHWCTSSSRMWQMKVPLGEALKMTEQAYRSWTAAE